jgi:hypothetical protein
MLASLGGSLCLLAYNDGGGARSHWLVRNVLNAGLYGAAEAGTTFVICASLSQIVQDLLKSNSFPSTLQQAKESVTLIKQRVLLLR